MPKPFLVLARMTVGRPVVASAASKAANSLRKSCPPRFKPSISLGRHMRDEVAHFRVLIEEVRQIVGAVPRAERLILAIDGGGEPAQQRVVDVSGEEGVPFRAPQHLDDVPACAAKGHLQFLDDLAVASHRPVEPLEIAVDDEGQIVELLARGEREARDRLRLVHLTVAEHAPDVPAIGVGEAAIAQDSA